MLSLSHDSGLSFCWVTTWRVLNPLRKLEQCSQRSKIPEPEQNQSLFMNYSVVWAALCLDRKGENKTITKGFPIALAAMVTYYTFH